MSMKLNNLEFIRLLPQFMREDTAVKGLAAGLDAVIPQLAEHIKYLSTWDCIDNLTENELDELAWELNILWYEPDADIDVKRDVIKKSDQVYRHLGTKWAVESVVTSYFGDGYIEEWFTYGGEPGRFCVHSSNTSITDEKLASFLNLLYKVKRASAKLEAIYLHMESSATLAHGACAELAPRMEVWPRAACAIDTTAAVAAGGLPSLHATLEIYPQGGLTNA